MAAKKKVEYNIGQKYEVLIGDVKVVKGSNVRKDFDRTKLSGLAQTIKAAGVIHPLSCYVEEGVLQLVAGERRLRASKLAGLKKVPVLIVDGKNDVELELIRAVENASRDDLTPLEEAEQFKRIIGQKGKLPGSNKVVAITAKALAEKVFRCSPGYISQRLALLDMPTQIQDALRKGKVTFAHCRELAKISSPEKQVEEFKAILRGERTSSDVGNNAAKGKAAQGGGKKGRGRQAKSDENGAPDVARQGIETLLGRLKKKAIDTRGKTEIKDTLGAVYEKHVAARSDKTKTKLQGAAQALEWVAGFRETPY